MCTKLNLTAERNIVATLLGRKSKTKAVYEQLVYICFNGGKRIYCKGNALTLSSFQPTPFI